MPDAPTYQVLIDDATQILYDSSDTPRIDAEVLIQHATAKPLAWLMAYSNTIAINEHIRVFYELVDKRRQGQPIAYITGTRDFWSLTLSVNESVLIPRPDTETLVEQALQVLPTESALALLDLGTGSGAIALSLAKERPLANVTAVDSEQDALKVAETNSALNGLRNIDFQQSNWFSEIPVGKRYHLIASNPPYIEASDPHLTQGDLRFEPDTALIASGNGLNDLINIISNAGDYLNNDGWLIVEHGYNQEQAVKALFIEAGFIKTSCHPDINGLPRCTIGQKS